MKQNIYITGFMGTGKTTIGKLLAKKLNMKFSDMDELLEKEFKLPIAQFFSKHGEKAFRQKETDLIKKLSLKKELVIGTGGGVPVKPENRNLMQSSGIILNLTAELDSIKSRLDSGELDKRPLWKDMKSVTALFNKRKQFYDNCDFQIITSNKKPEAIIDEILAMIKT